MSKIVNNSSSCNDYNVHSQRKTIEQDEINIYGLGPQQTHIHLSYPIEFNNIEETQNIIANWVQNFQIYFAHNYISNYNEWADEKLGSCGKPLIFSKIYEFYNNIGETSKCITILGNYYILQDFPTNNFYKLATTKFNSETEEILTNIIYNLQYGMVVFPFILNNTTYYTTIPFHLMNDISSDAFYQHIYYDLNILPAIYDKSLHIEFRAINKLAKLGGGLNNFYKTFGETTSNDTVEKSFYNFFKHFAENVNILIQPVIYPKYYNPSLLEFGIEIETCTNPNNY